MSGFSRIIQPIRSATRGGLKGPREAFGVAAKRCQTDTQKRERGNGGVEEIE